MADDVAAKAADSARKSALLALVCVVVAIAILLVDNQIKRHIVTKAGEARQILDEFGALMGRYTVGVSMDGRPEAAEPDATGSGSPGDPADQRTVGLGEPSAGRTDVDPPGHLAAPVIAEGAGGRAGGAAGPRGHG